MITKQTHKQADYRKDEASNVVLSVCAQDSGAEESKNPALSNQIIKLRAPKNAYGETIQTLASSFAYVHESTPVLKLAAEFKEKPEVWAVAIVNDSMSAKGIIVASMLQAMLSKPFAHEIMHNHGVQKYMEKSLIFDYDKHILTVSDYLKDDLQKIHNSYYLLRDNQNCFSGIFSSKDILIHQHKTHRADLAMAVTIQEAVVPKSMQDKTEHLEYYSSCRMAKGVGGDYVGIRKWGEQQWVFSVCDVSGKGIPASLVTTALGAMFSLFDFSNGLNQFVKALNSFILKSFAMEKYLTGLFIDYNEKTRVMTVIDMGHNYLYVLRDKKFKSFPCKNPFVGFLSELNLVAYQIKLKPNDCVIAFTDGYVEQQNSKGEEFGVPKFLDALAANSDKDFRTLSNTLHLMVKEFRGDVPRSDDESLLLIKIL
jgi:sigma-B regulation protein RsbU (phosphoserine phosphatase)